ncbi:MAG: RDD family protein [Bdellovibrionales bacterium]|nr:RDD family protein [Bdellovibrionales bacterium]
MDPFDEFEFKPLTEGLGFHKKQKSLRESIKESQLDQGAKPMVPSSIPLGVEEDTSLSASQSSVEKRNLTFEEIVTSLESAPLEATTDFSENKSNKVEFSSPLPRTKKPDFKLMDVEIEPTIRSPFPTQDTYKRPQKTEIKKVPAKGDLASVGTRRGAADSPQRRLAVSPGSLSASILDSVVVVAIGLIFTTALLTVTGVQLQTLVGAINTDLMTQIGVGVLLVAVMQIYFIISRTFFGRTLGEWTFDLQLGRDDEHRDEKYPLRVILRSVLVTMTGVIALPILSFIFRRDFAGMITGLNLYAQKS